MLLLVGAVLAGSIAVAFGAARVGVPSLVAFLALGMLLGSDGPGGIEFDDAELARKVGIIGLAAILYEGGLSTSWRRLRSVAVPAALLSTVGVVVTALLTGAAAYLLFDLSWLESVLLGAVVASTDAAAVFATLRYTHIRRRLARTLEAETGLNDPVAIALTIGLIDWIDKPSFAFPDLLLLVVRQLTLGLLIGLVLGAVAMWVFARLPQSIGAFVPVASVAAAALSFGAADVIGGSGFLAVYLVGLAVGSTPSRYRRQLVTFHEGLAFLAQVAMFVVLGLLVFPSDLPAVALAGLALAGAARRRDPAGRGLDLDRVPELHRARARAARLGRSSRRRPDRARDLRALVGSRQGRDDLQRGLLRGRRLDARSGNDARMDCHTAGARRSAARSRRGAARGGCARLARARRVRRRRRRRDRRRGGARARPSAQRVDRRRRTARRDDPAARNDGDPARRPPVRARAARDARRDSRTCSRVGGGACNEPGVPHTRPSRSLATSSSASPAGRARRRRSAPGRSRCLLRRAR